MRRSSILITAPLVSISIGRGGGVHTLPILTAPRSSDNASLQNIATKALYPGRHVRNIKDSDLTHWWKGEVGVSRNRIVHIGRLSLVPGLQARTWSTFLRHERSITPGQRTDPCGGCDDFQRLHRQGACRLRCSRLRRGRNLVRSIRTVRQCGRVPTLTSG